MSHKPSISKVSILLRLLLIGITTTWFACSRSEEYSYEQPNILLIVADDAGYSDFSCYGGEIPTPNIDALAQEGVLLTDFHVAPNCAPTRAALMSGVDNHLAGLGTMAELITDNQKGQPGYEGYLNFDVISLAEVMRLSGYRTYMTGKWHLGAKIEETRPYNRGFDRSFSMLAGGASHWADNTPLIPGKASPYSVNGKLISELPEDFYSSKNYVDSIISYINTDAASGKPFFAYLSFTAPHNPLHAPKEYIDKYKDKYETGWEEVANQRFLRQKMLGLIPQDQPAAKYPEWLPKWEELSANEKAFRAKDMQVYAAMIDYMDMSIGRLIDHLKDIEKFDNTMIVFISDNGASKTTIMDYASLGDEVASYLETFDNSLENKGLSNSAIDIGPGWAWAANTPFKLTKGYPTEGGMRVPCVIKMPSHYDVAPKQLSGFSYVYDLMPTFLELAGTEHPSKFQDNKLLPLQGHSMLSSLTQEKTTLNEREFGFEIYGMLTFRSGKWKSIQMPTPYGTGNWQLYNLENDLAEQNNLAEKHPEILRVMVEKYDKYARENGIVLPDKYVGYALPPE